MERERKNVTIKDVAKRAGVAISTVSRVLNGLDKVSEKTQKKVRDAVEELGYVQNALAVSMVTGQTKTILMAVPDFTNDFNAAVIQGGGGSPESPGLYHADHFYQGLYRGGLSAAAPEVFCPGGRSSGNSIQS